ncbi:MAG TPA: L-fucose:H+ symporter permease [Acidobacteriaceae bacterium]
MQVESPRSGGGRRASIFPAGQMLPFLLVTGIFFLWGMSNNLTDILVQQFRKSFDLSLLEAQLVQTAVFLAYGTMAVPAALLMRRFGYKAGLLVGLLVFGVGTLLFWPAAVMGRYAPFLFALFVVGSGSSVLETAANPLIAQFGDPATSEQRLNFAQAFNPPGTITGVLIGTWFIFSGIEKNAGQVQAMKAAGTYAAYLHTEIVRVVPTYVGLGLVVLALAAAIGMTRFPAALDAGSGDDDGASGGSLGRLVRTPRLMLAVVAQFFYVGAQVSTWSTLIPYIRAYTPASDKAAGYLLTATLVALGVGRIVSTALMRYVRPDRMIVLYAVTNVVLLSVGILRPGMVGAYAILATSFFMSIMYPTIFALGVKGLGNDTKLGSSLLVIAIVGGAIFPPSMGWVARATGSIALGYLLPALGYVVVALYGLVAARMGGVPEAAHG